MASKMRNTVQIPAPLTQDISLNCRYDKEWKTYFLTLQVFETSPSNPKPIVEEVVICINNKVERDKLLNMITKATEKIK